MLHLFSFRREKGRLEKHRPREGGSNEPGRQRGPQRKTHACAHTEVMDYSSVKFLSHHLSNKSFVMQNNPRKTP